MKIILYTGPQCELCEHALALIEQLDTPVTVEKINVRESVELYHLYGARIPVVKKITNQASSQASNLLADLPKIVANNPASTASLKADELGWPFSLLQLKAFLA